MILEQSDEFVDFRLQSVNDDADVPDFLGKMKCIRVHLGTHLSCIFSYLNYTCPAFLAKFGNQQRHCSKKAGYNGR